MWVFGLGVLAGSWDFVSKVNEYPNWWHKQITSMVTLL